TSVGAAPAGRYRRKPIGPRGPGQVVSRTSATSSGGPARTLRLASIASRASVGVRDSNGGRPARRIISRTTLVSGSIAMASGREVEDRLRDLGRFIELGQMARARNEFDPGLAADALGEHVGVAARHDPVVLAP